MLARGFDAAFPGPAPDPRAFAPWWAIALLALVLTFVFWLGYRVLDVECRDICGGFGHPFKVQITPFGPTCVCPEHDDGSGTIWEPHRVF